MKSLISAVLFACFAMTAYGQQTVNVKDQQELRQLQSIVATNAGITVSAVKRVELLDLGNGRFYLLGSASLDNGNSISVGTEVQNKGGKGGGGWLPVGYKITCKGYHCSECNIRGFPNINDLYCECDRKIDENSRCDMEKTIGVI